MNPDEPMTEEDLPIVGGSPEQAMYDEAANALDWRDLPGYHEHLGMAGIPCSDPRCMELIP